MKEKDDMRELLRREIAERELKEESEYLSGSLVEFVKASWEHLEPETEYVHNWHVDAICEHLEAVSRGQIRRLQVWMPPQSMKSRLVSILWPAWEWTFAPGTKYWTASYDNHLAGHLASVSYDLMNSTWYQERWGERFCFIRDAEHFFANSRGGHRLATSPDSKGTGYHGHRVLLDDALRAQQDDLQGRAPVRQRLVRRHRHLPRPGARPRAHPRHAAPARERHRGPPP